MPFSITGSLHNTTLSALGTNEVTVATTPFVSTQFTTSRVVALFSSTGAFKCVGYVRRFMATNRLELESPIYDPANGNEPIFRFISTATNARGYPMQDAFYGTFSAGTLSNLISTRNA